MDTSANPPAPPRATQRPHSFEAHGVTIEDPWHWLRDPKYPEVEDQAVLDYLKAENDYFEAAMAPHQALVDTLFEEMKGRIKEDESSVPIRDGDWLYWWAFKPGAQYRSWYRQQVRRRAGRDAVRRAGRGRGQGLFPPRRARGQPGRQARRGAGRRQWLGAVQARIRDLASGKDLETVTDVAIGQPVWSSDSDGIVFNEVNENWRSYRARYHRLGAPGRRGCDAVRGDRGARLQRRRVAVAGPQPDLHLDRRQCDQRSALRPRRRPDRAADPDLAAQGEARIFGRRGARQIVDPDQRRPCEFPPRRGRSGRAGASGRR